MTMLPSSPVGCTATEEVEEEEEGETREALWVSRDQRRSESLRRLREIALAASTAVSFSSSSSSMGSSYGGGISAFEALLREKARISLIRTLC